MYLGKLKYYSSFLSVIPLFSDIHFNKIIKFAGIVNLFLLMFCLIFIENSALATNYYVNDGSTTGDYYCTVIGSASNTGLTSNSPKITIAQILALSPAPTANDTVFIDAGTYTVSQQMFRTACSGSSSGQITFQGLDTSKTIFTAASNTAIFYVQENSSYLTFRNIQFYQSSTTNGQNMFTVEGGNCQNIQIVNCEFNNSAKDASCLYSRGLNTLISNCIFNTRSLYAILLGTNHLIPSATINGCSINVKNNLNATNYGIFCNSATTTPNTINNNKIIGDATSTYGIYFDGVSNATIQNNYISGFGTGIWSGNSINNNFYFNSIYARTYAIFGNASNSLSGWKILNNIFDVANAGGNVIKYNSGTSFPTTQNYNLYYSSGGATLFNYGGTTYATTAALCSAKSFECNAISGDPKFSNPSAGNLDLTSGSAAATVGLTISGITTDIYNTTRPSPPSIGACELISVLPVELISFGTKCYENYLMFLWSTATETNNNFFTIESSKDGENFEPIAIVQGAGNSNKIKNYTYSYDASYYGDLYCRLKQTDYNGQYSYSNIILQNNCNDTLNSSPKIISVNNDKGLINVLFKSAIYKNFTIHVFCADGRLIATKTGITNDNITNVQMPYYQSSSAVYILNLQINNFNISKKFFLKANN